MPQTYDLVVIGAGPAGLAAATQAAALGLHTLLLDEQSEPGGQIYRMLESAPAAHRRMLGTQYERGLDLLVAFRKSTSEYQPDTTVVEVTPDGWIGYLQGETCAYIRAQRIIIATGALERPCPIPGWTTPGVMTAGAAQILLKAHQSIPRGRSIIAGSGPLIYVVACQLLSAGHKVEAVLDTTPRENYRAALAYLLRALSSSRELATGLGMLATLSRKGVRHLRWVQDLAVERGPSGALKGVSFRIGRQVEHCETDLALLHQGVMPNVQLTQSLRCAHDWDSAQLCWRPAVDAWGQTSEERIFVAGDGAGIDGARAAVHKGALSAIAAAYHLGRISGASRDTLSGPIWTLLEKDRRIRPFLDALYRPADTFRVPADDHTLICRCEEVSMADMRRAVELGCPGPNQAKAFIRAGMGPCQGRFCGTTICETIAALRKVSPAEVGYFRIRPPIKPVSLGALATMVLPSDENEKATPATPLPKVEEPELNTRAVRSAVQVGPVHEGKPHSAGLVRGSGGSRP